MIRTVLQLFIILSFLHLRSEAGSCYIYSKNSQRRCTGWFGWDCSYYYYSTKSCCYDYEGTTCSKPRCRYGYGSHTCNKDDEGYVKYPNGNVIKNSGGECYEPSKCRNCNKGYYPVTSRNGYCKACYKPSHCYVPVCLSSSNYWCEYCEGEYNRMKPGYNVYTGHPDNRKCQRACSWTYGARCFPGTCTGHMILDKDCKCAKGFTSKDSDCSKATTTPDIKQMYFILHQSSRGDNIYVDKALQKKIFWTKETEWSSISLRATSNYKAEIDSLNKPNYITGYYIGVQELKMVLTLTRGLKMEEWTIDGGCTNFDETCDKKITDNVLSSISPWRQILNFRYFQHGDKIKFKVSATNGGKILYEDRGKTGRPYREGQYFLNGMTVNEALELRFDSLQPTHCFEQDYDCGKDPLTATDFLTKPKLEVSWDGWSDSDSGIDKYELNIYYLENSLHNNLLEHKYKLSGMSYSSSKCSATLKLEAPGPYSVELSVHDHAKNYKVARRIILYDNASVVDLYGQPARIVQAQETGWINKLSNHIEIKWQDRFRNIRHSDGGWLNGVRKIEEISRILDDQEGRSNRTVDRLYNIDGIVRFDIARKVDYNGVFKYIGFEPVPQIFFKLERMVYYDEEFVDGKRLKFYIRGVDALGKYAEDTVTAMIDLSPPIIQNFRLSQSIRNSINNINKKYQFKSEAGSCYKYLRRSKETCTGWWSRRCSTKYYSSKVCCDNYSGATCSIPKCRGGYGTNTCNINNEGYVKYKDGKVVRNSGGVCYAPSRCRNCNKGYYPVTSSGGYCKACFQPQHCNLPVCTSSNNYRCDYCEGEYIREKPGYYVYTGKPDSKKCQKACSWVDGARCFPGTCSGNMILGRDCQCAIGFNGKDCSSATTSKVPTMLSMYFKLHGSANKVKIVDKAFQKSIIWLKDTDWSNISIQASSYYRLDIDNSKIPNYITNYYIGIEEQKIVLTLLRGTDYGEWNIDGGCTNFHETCDKEISNISLSSIGPWRNILNNGGFKHADKIKFKVSAKNGGKVTYEDRSSFTQPYAQKHYFLNGVATNEEFELHFDVFPPVHCFEQHNDCQQDALNVTDFLTQPKFTASWNGWTDSDSGIEEYEFNIYYLENSHDDNFLEHKRLLSTNRFAPSESSATLDLEEPGPYSVELIVHDRAKNYKVARRIILYDNASVVDLYGKQARVVQVQENGWINKHTENIEIVWQNRFRNIRHSNGGWLNGVKETEDIVTDLDDSKGKSARTIDKLNNIGGIVRFDISRKVEINGISYSTPFEPVPDCLFRLERMVYTDEEIVDGKRLTYVIRGVDVFGKFAEDNVSAMIDVSPPLIQNISVRFTVREQSAPKENELIVALEAFDYHSGMNKVSWKIFHNSTKDASINHGQSQKDLIGEVLVRKTKTIDECKDTDTVHTDGTNCYCTPYSGCYHRDIQVKTELSNGNKNGLNNGSTTGKFDYFIEVNATNNAGLTTFMKKKVTF